MWDDDVVTERASDAYPATQASITPSAFMHEALDFVAAKAETDPVLKSCLRMAEDLFREEIRQEVESFKRFERLLAPRPPKPKAAGPYYFTTW